MNISFVENRNFYFIFSGILIIGSIICLVVFGINLGIDFTGGSILEIEYKNERPENKIIKDSLTEFNLREVVIQPTEERGVILRMTDISEDTHQRILEKLKETGEFEEKRFESIGPVIGSELKEKTKIFIVISLLAIALYIAFAFWKISRPVASWQYGITSLFCLFHDILIPLGIFSILGKYCGTQITIPVIVALLTVVGYSINNTVVVYDRIRENLLKSPRRGFGEDFDQIVNQSINQTLTRQINTSLTTLFPLFFIFFFGGETLKYFALTLILGIIAGTYSSAFLAGPILVNWLKFRKRS